MSKLESIITNDLEHCIICGNPTVAIHHAIGGTANRRLSDEDRLLIPLCPKHHNMDSKESVHLNPIIARWSKMVGQLAFETEMVSTGKAKSKDEARKQFRLRYGKSFL